MPWAKPKYVVYDIPNENILLDQILIDKDLRRNKIRMTWEQAESIRRAKGLPMPSPPVEVEIVNETKG